MIVALIAGRDTPAELRARLALDEEGQRRVLRARTASAELVVLSTCHRIELYAFATGSEVDAAGAMVSLLPVAPDDRAELRFLRGAEAVEHLYRVACGLDSLMIGEPQILRQVRRSLLVSQQENAAGPNLSNVFGRAIRLGRRARSETSLGSLSSSIGALAAQRLDEMFDGLASCRVVIVGAGEAATDVAGSLAGRGARIAVVSRTLSSARRLAAAVGGTAHGLDEMPRVLDEADCGVVAVGSGTLIHPHHVPARAERPPLVLVDISVPSAVAIPDRDDVQVRTLEDLSAPDVPEAAAAVAEVEAIVRLAVDDFKRWAGTRARRRAIGDLRAHAEQIALAEVKRALGGMNLADTDRARIEAVGLRIAKRLLHGPTVAMRDADPRTQAIARRMFGLGS